MESVRLLLVDPDDQYSAGYVQLFSDRGWVVDHARTFSEAMDLVLKSSYNIAILELDLPDAVGTDAWRDLKQVRPDMIGIITTQSPSLRNIVNPLESGIVAFLLKPIETNAIHQIIDRVLRMADL